MRVLRAGLQAHLNAGVTTLCRCWRMQRTDGAVLGFTDHDRSVEFNEDGEWTVFSPASGLNATGDVAKTGFGVGGLEIEGAFNSEGLDPVDLQSGRYDGATVSFWLVNWQDPSQRVLLRRGTLGEVTRRDGAFRVEVRGPMQGLETIRGRVFTHTCDADLGDKRCRVPLDAFARTATVLAVDGGRLVVGGLDDVEAGHFAGGSVRVGAGAQVGAMGVVLLHTVEGVGVVLTLRSTLLGVTAGDTLDVVPGCDKRFTTCADKFRNTENFRGFPHLPGNDRALSYARSA